MIQVDIMIRTLLIKWVEDEHQELQSWPNAISWSR